MSGDHSVVLRLDPKAMENPDIDVRWDLDKAVQAAAPELLFSDDGYGFAQHSDAMLLSYATNDADRLVAVLVSVLETQTIRGNRLASAAMIAIAPPGEVPPPGQEFIHHKVVYPRDQSGQALPD